MLRNAYDAALDRVTTARELVDDARRRLSDEVDSCEKSRAAWLDRVTWGAHVTVRCLASDGAQCVLEAGHEGECKL